jgi:hypothetical protein
VKKYVLYNTVTRKVLLVGKALTPDSFWARRVSGSKLFAKVEKDMHLIEVFSEAELRKMLKALERLK